MKIILIGASGRLGGAIQRVLTHHDYIIPSIDELNLTKPETIHNFVGSNTADLLVNCAAYNDVDGAEDNKELAMTINGHAPGELAKACAKVNLPMVHFSSDYVFSGENQDGYTEADEPHPISVYGESKHLGEKLVLENNEKSYLIRTSRLYGPPGEDPKSKNSFVDLVLRLASEKDEISMLDVEWTANTHVDDLARHLDKYIFTLPEPGIYHLVNQGRSTWYEWAKKIVELKGLPTHVAKLHPSALPRKAKRPDFSLLLNTKLPPMRDWEEALKEFLG